MKHRSNFNPQWSARLTTVAAMALWAWIGESIAAQAATGDEPFGIPIVGRMPEIPRPYQLRDWRQVTRDYLDFVFDFEQRGEHLPLMRWKNEQHSMVWMPAYVGNKEGTESINYLAAIVSGSLVGVDMRRYRGQDWVSLGTNFFSPADGVFLDWAGGQSGGSLWYDVLPNVLFFQLGHLYPGDMNRDRLLLAVADRWYQACVALGGGTHPPTLPNFDHTGFNTRTMRPYDNGERIEPEGAAGIAWLAYMAWRQSHDPRFLTAADWCLRFLESKPRERSPLYEVLLPYGAFIAARMNAELGGHYDVPKLLNWCFESRPKPQARPGWGVIADRWNGLDAHGLVGSTTDGGGYAFAMNTFQWAGALVPVARYDDRYARDIGKWMLNLANAARLFYPNAHDAAHQSSSTWAKRYDHKSVLAYEGIRKWKRGAVTAQADFRTRAGRIVAGSFASTRFYREEPPQVEVLEEAPVGEAMRLEHVWEFKLPDCARRWLVVAAERVDARYVSNAFGFSFASHPDGPFTDAFSVSQPGRAQVAELPDALRGRLYLKVESTDHSPGQGKRDQLRVDAMAIAYRSDLGPFAQGDLVVSFIDLLQDSTVPILLYRPESAVTDLGLYGSSHAGILGGIIKPTNVEKILQLDLLKTDYFHGPAYPTFLYYNPYDSPKAVQLDAGTEAKDLYDAVSNGFVQRKAQGTMSISIPPHSARVVVLAPAGGQLTRDGQRTLIDGVVVDFINPSK